MKIILSIAFFCIITCANAQKAKNNLITIIESINDIIEPGKEYLVLVKNKGEKLVLSAAGCDVKILTKGNKYYIITKDDGDVLISVSFNGKYKSPPYKFYSKKKE